MERGIYRKYLFLVSLISTIMVKGISGQCVVFDEIPEADYDRTYSLINDVDARPLGFKWATLKFDGNDICYSSVGVGDGRGVEVAYEAVPRSNLCVRNKDGVKLGCGSKTSHCSQAVNDPTEFHFYLDVAESGTESDVNFWLRVTQGIPAVNDTENMWCSERSVSYPTSLGNLPGFVTPPPTTTDSGSSYLTSSLLTVTFTVFSVAALITNIHV